MRVNAIIVVITLAFILFIFPAYPIPGLSWPGDEEETTRNCPVDDPYCNPYSTAASFEETSHEEPSCWFFCSDESDQEPDEEAGGLIESGIEYFKDAIKFKK